MNRYPNLSDSHMRILRHQKEPYEYVFGAMIYCFKVADEETAELLKTHLECIEGGNDCELCDREHREYKAFCERTELVEVG